MQADFSKCINYRKVREKKKEKTTWLYHLERAL